jgi:hypothetical protein
MRGDLDPAWTTVCNMKRLSSRHCTEGLVEGLIEEEDVGVGTRIKSRCRIERMPGGLFYQNAEECGGYRKMAANEG